jgi:very-short-patch-repair endonuclease
MRSKVDKSTRDALIARVAANQHGVITTVQLNDAGLSRGRIAERTKAGRLHPVHRGVHAVGHPRLSDKGRWMAAVLASGKGAVLSHTSAAELWGIRRASRRGRASESTAVHVTVPNTSGKGRRDGIMLHRSTTLIARDCTRRDGIPVTTPARTLADLRPLLSPGQLAAAIREAEFVGLATRGQVGAERARSELEQLFLYLCRRHRLPQPLVNARVEEYEVDFLWREESLIAEVDGWQSHRTRSAFEEDRIRDAQLSVLGYRVLRFTWRQIDTDPRGVARTIRRLLRAR